MIKNKTKIPSRIAKPQPIKNFNAVDWIRKVRDNMAEKNKKLNIHSYVKKITSEIS